MTKPNRATESIIESVDKFLEAFQELEPKLSEADGKLLKAMLLAYYSLYEETMKKNDVIGRIMREKAEEIRSINHELSMRNMEAQLAKLKELRGEE